MQQADVGRLITAALDSAANSRASTVGLVGPRGSGKTWWLDRAAEQAQRRQFLVVRARGGYDDHEVPFGALAAILGSERNRLRAPEWAALHAVLDLDHRRVEALDVKVAAFRFLCTLAETQPVCVVLDDTHWFDAASIDVLGFVARRAEADAIAILATSTHELAGIVSATTRLAPTPVRTIQSMLVGSGLDDLAAARCSEASHGNPGIARALADGLTDQQRSGSAPVSVLPRPSGTLVDELQARLRSYGENVCHALVVAAAEHSGEVAAAKAALATLGEHDGGLHAAESLGLLEIVGAQFTFTDPWIRLVAYHLVAPASRRSAHLALAGWFAGAEQAAQRAWHLAAGSVGPDAAVAESLELVASDAARRGGLASAAVTSERAADFSVTPHERQRNVLTALRWWMETGTAEAVRRLLNAIDPLDHDAAVARAEASEFLDGIRVDIAWNDVAADGWWSARRAERVAIAAAVEQGDHRAALRALNATACLGDAVSAVLAAGTHRLAGRTREAREASTTASVLLDGSTAFDADVARLVAADLDILHGRGTDATTAIGDTADVAAPLREWASGLAARARLQIDPNLAAIAEPDAFVVQGAGPLRQAREAIRTGVLHRDATTLASAVELATRQAWPIEAGEARMWLAGLQSGDERAATLTLARAALQRCGVRAWDLRLAKIGEPTAQRRTGQPDPGLDALSQAEFRVAGAVAAGLTNRQAAAELIISVKTVDFHLQQMYRKLGIRSRTELAVRMTNFEPARGGLSP